MQKARLIIEKDLKASHHMASDEALLEYAINNEKDFIPALRLYTWSPAGISLGYFQKTEKEINIDNCRKHGVDIIRRPTGGKSVLHDDELTYCFIFKMDDPNRWTILDAFKKINEALLYAIKRMGVKAQLVSLKKHSPKEHTAVCFAVPSSYEIKVDNKKIIGSAQKRAGNFVLQHGSVPITIDRNKLYDLFNFKSEEERKKQAEESVNIMTSLKEAAPFSDMNFDNLAEGVKEGFEKVWGISLYKDKLNKEEEGIRDKLIEIKYGTDDWNYNKLIKNRSI
ncbi:MAG: biotin/lipoate A/B protein ligase family protein [Armatimonadota bacterium]